MRKLLATIIQAATVLTIFSVQTYAQNFSIEPKPETSKEIPEATKNLMQFLGRWEAEITLTLEGKENKINYWVEGKKASGGYALYADEGFTHPELGTMIGTNLAGFDPGDGKIKWFSVDNMGTTHVHVGEWITPDRMVMEYNGTKDGQAYFEKIEFVFKMEKNIIFSLVRTINGAETERAEGVFQKVNATAVPPKKPAAPPVKKQAPVKK